MSDVKRTLWRRVSQKCPHPKGTRIELISMDNDPCPITPGTQGTVVGGSGAQLWVNWDNGRSLNLLVGEDQYKVIATP